MTNYQVVLEFCYQQISCTVRLVVAKKVRSFRLIVSKVLDFDLFRDVFQALSASHATDADRKKYPSFAECPVPSCFGICSKNINFY